MAVNRSDLTTRTAVIPEYPGVTETILRVTVIYHPDPDRIGDYYELAANQSKLAIGRSSPAFVSISGDHADRPLNDAHISRSPVQFQLGNSTLTADRQPGGSRVQIGTREVKTEPLQLEVGQLVEGVSVMLAHRVVLLLRYSAPRSQLTRSASPFLLGSSQQMCELLEQSARAAAAGLDVLLTGETGTGKELVAREVHRLSARQENPFVAINMSAIAPSLAAAELFGHTRGAYTGADRARAGFFGQAEGGYLFLDEIGDVPAEVQPQLLRALQQREIQVVGGDVRKVDLVVISATDQELDASDSSFDRALRYRLAACEIQLPPLRHHPEDVGELGLHFFSLYRDQLGDAPPLPGETDDAYLIACYALLFHQFMCCRWPGNIRQLENAVRQVVLASDETRLVVPAVVTRSLTDVSATRYSTRPLRDPAQISEGELLAAMEKNRYELANAARQLHISRPGIYRRIKTSPSLRTAAEIPLEELRESLAQHEGALGPAAAALKVSRTALSRRLRAERIIEC